MTSKVGSKDGRGNKQPKIVKQQVRDYLEKLDVFKSIGPDI